ncbi:Xenobiotic-transporting ATPase / Multidrug resistance-associated protein [Spironucleus salmonicida]|uniref:Multidrug resistance-associated protein n=2 Tax=Spironucleus TaxID=39709 RepID=V6LSR8_9EUKA|nr:ATP-binding cassette subfamily C (CFTR/MRP) member 5 [Spironucleus barkhanus]KAH0570876.1 Xenobiotic-transporting ATPase / Multidrug resistance-associated protein [Spironucleus salmonicida]|eukprot:EST43834.1 Multidrug resistance-associated protein [Spironucleus salmonicida]
MRDMITFSWMNPLIKRIKSGELVTGNDIGKLDEEFNPAVTAAQIMKTYNDKVKQGKKPSFFNTALKANINKLQVLFITTPLLSLSAIISPLAVQKFTSILMPSTFADCDQLLAGTPKYVMIPYLTGLAKIFKQLYPYLILVGIAQYTKTFSEALAYQKSLKMATCINTGFLDLLYNKILRLSNHARSNSSTGNLVNLLYTDTQKMALLMYFFPLVFQIPLDMCAYIIYMAINVDPMTFLGLIVYLLVFPVISLVMSSLFAVQRRGTNIRDLRIQKTTEILNGIKVVKLFSMEDISEKRLQNIRRLEVQQLFKYGLAITTFTVVKSIAAPLMVIITFGTMLALNRFDLSQAFTMLFLFQFLAIAIIILPMVLSYFSDAVISANRIGNFMTLPERDNGVVLNKEKSGDSAIEIINKPSFTWASAKDQFVPPILDPFFKENIAILKQITSTLPKLTLKYQELVKSVVLDALLPEEKEEFSNNIDKEIIHQSIVDIWCVELDVIFVSRLENLQQYLPIRFEILKSDPILLKAKKLCVQIRTMQKLIQKTKVSQLQDLPNVLHDLELDIKHGQLIGICGPVGSGKSSFFHSILGELRLNQTNKKQVNQDEDLQYLTFEYDGVQIPKQIQELEDIFIKINGSVAYFPQNPSIFNATVRDNITFGKVYNREKYDKVCDVCCLLPDFKIMGAGDQTEVGGKGVTLSGGQKARVALARAVYSDCDIYLLDDPLSAVDSHVGHKLWNDAIKDYLISKGKTVVIASHQTHFFVDCDKIINLVDGKFNFVGNIEEMMAANISIMGLTDNVSSSQISKAAEESVIDKMVEKKEQTGISVIPVIEEKPQENDGKLTEEEKQSGSGTVSGKAYMKWITSGTFSWLIIAFVFYVINYSVLQYTTILISQWSQDAYGWSGSQDLRPACLAQCPNSVCPSTTGKPQLQSCNAFLNTPADLPSIVQCITQSGSTFPLQQVKSSPNYLYLYIGCTVVIIISVYSCNILFIKFCIDAAQRLHLKMLCTVIRQKMSFFDTTPQGRIQNRFAKDTDSVDFNIMNQLQYCLQTFFMIISMIISMAIINYPVLVLIIPAIIIFISIFVSFRKVFPQLKRIDAITRSPVFATCGETVDCLLTIRSYGRQKDFQAKFREQIKTNIHANYLSLILSRWMAFRLSALCATFAFLVTLICLLVTPLSFSFATYTGVIISQAFTITYILLDFVNTMVQVDSEMASVERVIEYSELPVEGVFVNNAKVPENWPVKSSAIEIKNLSFRYRPELDLVLKNINFKIMPGEHIGIVGRTGAGKSSITQALFRLAEAEEGAEIIIDGVDIRKLGLHTARGAITIIPQDPFLFSGTLRQQLCQRSQADAENVKTDIVKIQDTELWRVLDSVQMGTFFRNQPGGLDCKISQNGDNLSAGQKQLVCVARALIKNCCLVILDEATAQVDRENDALIQRTLRDTLHGTAILSIAHRLDTIIDFDKVIVVDKGEIVEMGGVYDLIQQRGQFYDMVMKTGDEMSQRLIQMAKDCVPTE